MQSTFVQTHAGSRGLSLFEFRGDLPQVVSNVSKVETHNARSARRSIFVRGVGLAGFERHFLHAFSRASKVIFFVRVEPTLTVCSASCATHQIDIHFKKPFLATRLDILP